MELDACFFAIVTGSEIAIATVELPALLANVNHATRQSWSRLCIANFQRTLFTTVKMDSQMTTLSIDLTDITIWEL